MNHLTREEVQARADFVAGREVLEFDVARVLALIDERDALKACWDKADKDFEACEAERDAAMAQVAALREALDRVTAGVWDRLYAKGPLSAEYAQAVQAQVDAALASTAEAAKAHDAKVHGEGRLAGRAEVVRHDWLSEHDAQIRKYERAAALEKAAIVAENSRFSDGPYTRGTIESQIADVLRALARGGR